MKFKCQNKFVQRVYLLRLQESIITVDLTPRLAYTGGAFHSFNAFSKTRIVNGKKGN